jgi:hypothetical protein
LVPAATTMPDYVQSSVDGIELCTLVNHTLNMCGLPPCAPGEAATILHPWGYQVGINF